MKECKWGLNQPIKYIDATYGEISILACGSYELINQAGFAVIENIDENYLMQINQVIVSNVQIIINSLNGKNYNELINNIDISAILNKCNSEISNLGIIISKLNFSKLEPTLESMQKISQSSNPIQPNNNIEHPKKNSKITTFVIILIVVIIGGYAIYNKFLNTPKDATSNEIKEESIIYSDNKFGLSSVPFNDEEYGLVYLNVYGTYSFEIYDAEKFKEKIGDPNDLTEDIKEQIRTELTASIQHSIQKFNKEFKIYSLLPGEVENISSLDKINEYFDWTQKGLRLTKVNITSIRPTNESAKEINEITRRNLNISSDTSNVTLKSFDAEIYLLSKEEGGRHTPCFPSIRWRFKFADSEVEGIITSLVNDEMMMPGEKYNAKIELDKETTTSTSFEIYEKDKLVGRGTIKG